MNKYLCSLMIVLFLASGCANNKYMQPRTVEDYYAPTGVSKYFLSDIPPWANFDQKAGCFRQSSIRYFDINALMKSYSITYSEALQLQATFNEEFIEFKKAQNPAAPMLKEEELLFYKVSEKVFSKIIFFDPPDFKRVNLVWLDEIVGDEKKEKKLKSFLNSAVMDTGVPVLVTFCMTRQEAEKRYPDLNAKMISAELFSIYDSKGAATPGFKFDLNQFFKPEQKIYFYSQKNLVPTEEFVGALKILNY